MNDGELIGLSNKMHPAVEQKGGKREKSTFILLLPLLPLFIPSPSSCLESFPQIFTP